MKLEEYHEGNLGGCAQPPACPFLVNGVCTVPTHVCAVRQIAGTSFTVRDVAELLFDRFSKDLDRIRKFARQA